MLIKHRLYGSSALLIILTLIVMAVTWSAFSSLSEHFKEVSQAAHTSSQSASHAAKTANQTAQNATQTNQHILTLVDSIKQTNQTSRLASKKVKDMGTSLSELVNLIDELSEDVTDQEAISILEEVSDEISDIEERVRREVLLNMTTSAEHVKQSSNEIAQDAQEISRLNNNIKELAQLATQAVDSSAEIEQVSNQSLEEIQEQKNLILTTLIILTLVAIASGLFMIRLVLHPINQTVHHMDDVAKGEGDLTQRLESSDKTEMAQIATAFNLFVEKVQSLIVAVSDTTHSLKETSNQTYEEMHSGHQALVQQLQEIEQIATAVEQMNVTSRSVSENAIQASSATTSANEKLSLGRETVTGAQKAVAELVKEVGSAVDVIDHLDEKSQDINEVVNVITAVAEQTNLLALNAAIEAARAGEQGRGFAVVADEVRTLAGKAESGANDIRNIIEQIQSMTTQAVAAMKSSQSACNQTVEGTDQVFNVLNDVSQEIQTIDEMNTQIASAAEQETAVTENINQRIHSVNQFSRETSTGVEHTVEACEQLNQMADQVHQQLSQFKV